jgi:hypothetical protein
MLSWVFQDLVAGHDAPVDFIQYDMATKLDEGPPFVTRDGARVRLKEAEHFLA